MELGRHSLDGDRANIPLEPPEQRLQRMQTNYLQQLKRAQQSGLVGLGPLEGVEGLEDTTPRKSPPKPARMPPPAPFSQENTPNISFAPSYAPSISGVARQPSAFQAATPMLSISATGEGHPMNDKNKEESGANTRFTPASLAMMTHDDKDRAIVMLQREIASLKARLTKVLDTTDATMADLAQAQERAYQEQTEREVELQKAVEHWKTHHPEVSYLSEENKKITAELDEERKNLRFAMRKLERVHEREAKMKAAAKKAPTNQPSDFEENKALSTLARKLKNRKANVPQNILH